MQQAFQNAPSQQWLGLKLLQFSLISNRVSNELITTWAKFTVTLHCDFLNLVVTGPWWGNVITGIARARNMKVLSTLKKKTYSEYSWQFHRNHSYSSGWNGMFFCRKQKFNVQGASCKILAPIHWKKFWSTYSLAGMVQIVWQDYIQLFLGRSALPCKKAYFRRIHNLRNWRLTLEEHVCTGTSGGI